MKYLVLLGALLLAAATATADWQTGCDFDKDGAVTISDFATFIAAMGSKTGDPQYNAIVDLNYDGQISIADFAIYVRFCR